MLGISKQSWLHGISGLAFIILWTLRFYLHAWFNGGQAPSLAMGTTVLMIVLVVGWWLCFKALQKREADEAVSAAADKGTGSKSGE